MIHGTQKKWLIPVTVSIIAVLSLVNLSLHILDTNILIFSFAAILSALLLISSEELLDTDTPNKNVKTDASRQSAQLIENLSAMVNKLEYRDNVLIQEKERAEAANNAKNDFIAKMSHELRTPMHAILNFADAGIINCTGGANDEKIITCFTRIEESGDRLLKIINGLLDLTKLESGKANLKFEKNNLLECINTACNELAAKMAKKSVTINIQNRNSIRTFLFDKDHITIVLVNLISNALKFAPENSSISIIIERKKYNFYDNVKTNGIKVSIEDNGIGIEESEKEMIFSKFTQGSRPVKEGGSGLGLAISKEIINAHSGNIWAENQERHGARISFIIPE